MKTTTVGRRSEVWWAACLYRLSLPPVGPPIIARCAGCAVIGYHVRQQSNNRPRATGAATENQVGNQPRAFRLVSPAVGPTRIYTVEAIERDLVLLGRLSLLRIRSNYSRP